MTWHWREIGGISDPGDVHPDVQASRGYQRRFARQTARDTWQVVDISHYAAACEDHPTRVWVEAEYAYTECTIPTRPGDTETWADVRYVDIDRRVGSVRDAEQRALQLTKRLRPSGIEWIGD